MRILQVLLAPSIGGAESLAHALAKEWASLGVENEISYLDSFDSEQKSRRKRLANVRKAVAMFKPDVVVAHTALPNIYVRAATRKSLPKIVVLHSSARDFSNRRLRIAERILQRRTQHVIGVGDSQVDEYRKHFGNSVPCTVIPNGVRSDLPYTDTRIPERYQIVTLARVAIVKNPILWEDVAERLGSSAVVEFVWWGPTSDTATMQLVDRHRSAMRPGLFAGPTEDAGVVLSDAALLFHPSDRESQGLSLIEAACVGLPIVCSDVVAANLPPEVGVVTFPVGNAERAAEAILNVMRNYEAYSSTARRMAPVVRSMYGIEACAQRYLRVCKSVTDVVVESSCLSDAGTADIAPCSLRENGGDA